MVEGPKSKPAKQRAKKMHLPKRMFREVPSFFNDVEFRPAQSIREIQDAGKLVYKEYLSRDYIKPNENRMNFSLFQAVPGTVTFVAVHKHSRVLGTVTLIIDSALGLPMDKIYSEETNKLREQGLRLAEAGRLAIDEEALATDEFHMSRGQRLLFLFNLYAALLTHFRDQQNIDQLVACFHPRHEFIYEFMGFMPMGGLKSYESVQGSPAIARVLVKKDILVHVHTHPNFQNVIFFWDRAKHTTPSLAFSKNDLKLLFVQQSTVFAEARPEQLQAIESMYSDLNISELLSEPTPGLTPTTSLISILTRDATPSSHVDTHRLEQSLINMSVSSSDRMVIFTHSDGRHLLMKKAAQNLGIEIFLIETSVETKDVEKKLTEFSPTILFANNAAQFLNVDAELLEKVQNIILTQKIDSNSPEELSIGMLFSPPITSKTSLFYWNELA